MAGLQEYSDYFSGLGKGGVDPDEEFARKEADRLAREKREAFWATRPDVAPPQAVRDLSSMPEGDLTSLTNRTGAASRAAEAARGARARTASYLPTPGGAPEEAEDPKVAAQRQIVGPPGARNSQPFTTDLNEMLSRQAPMEPGSGVRLPADPSQGVMGGHVPEAAPAGQVAVTIDGKTYQYGGGQAGGAPSFAVPNANGQGTSVEGFGGELRRLGRVGPLQGPDPEAIARAGGSFSQMEVSPDSPGGQYLAEQQAQERYERAKVAAATARAEGLAADPFKIEEFPMKLAERQNEFRTAEQQRYSQGFDKQNRMRQIQEKAQTLLAKHPDREAEIMDAYEAELAELEGQPGINPAAQPATRIKQGY